eukprot:14252267-Ditylum_brightwellii.AAC.1
MELKKRDKIIKSYCQSLPSIISSRHNNKPHPTQGKTNHTSYNYTAGTQVGPGKEFLNKSEIPGCGVPSANPGVTMSKSPAVIMPCHKPTGLPILKPPTKPPSLLFQVKTPSTLPLQMNP